MNNYWTTCFFIWTLALARGFSHPLIAQQRTALSRPFATSRTVSLIRGGQQDEEIPDISTPTTADLAASQDSVADTVQSSAAAPLAGMTALVASFAKSYEGSLLHRPILTKSATAGIIFGLSDYLAQKIESRNVNKTVQTVKPVDWARVLASVGVGFLYFGPAAHYWYEWVFRILPGTSLASTLQKAALGQLIFGPCFTCVYFGVGLAQAGKFSLKNWANKIRQDLFGAWLAGTSFWPLIDIISYSLVPQTYIPLFVNMASLVWTIYLSLLTNKVK